MGDIVKPSVTVLNEKMAGADFDGTAIPTLKAEALFMMDSTGARKEMRKPT